MGNGTVLQIRPAGEKMWCLRDLLSAIPIFFFFLHFLFCVFFLSTLPPKMNCSMLFQVSLGNCSAPVCKNGCPFPLILHSRAIYGYFLSLFLSSLARLQWGTIMSCSLQKKKKQKRCGLSDARKGTDRAMKPEMSILFISHLGCPALLHRMKLNTRGNPFTAGHLEVSLCAVHLYCCGTRHV